MQLAPWQALTLATLLLVLLVGLFTIIFKRKIFIIIVQLLTKMLTFHNSSLPNEIKWLVLE